MVMVTTPDLKTDCKRSHYRQTSVAGLTYAVVAEWQQIPAARFLNVVERQKMAIYSMNVTFRCHIFLFLYLPKCCVLRGVHATFSPQALHYISDLLHCLFHSQLKSLLVSFLYCFSVALPLNHISL